MTSSEDAACDPTQRARLRQIAFEAARFIGSGLLAFPLGLGVAAFCRELLGWRAELATATAFATLLCVNFVLGRRLVFRSAGPVKHELRRFVAVAIVMRCLESLLSITLLKVLGIPYLVSIAGALAISSMVKFFLYRSWVFIRPAAAPEDPDRRSPR